ncbi:MAG: hypothetical protein AABW90_01515 [Nanoarchaeota archaeon]
MKKVIKKEEMITLKERNKKSDRSLAVQLSDPFSKLTALLSIPRLIIIFSLFLLTIIISLTILNADATFSTPFGSQIDFLTKTNAQKILVNGKSYYLFENVESLVVKYTKGFTSNYLNLKPSSEGQQKLIFGLDGKLVEAYFKTGQEGNYVLGNEQIFLPAGTEVHFKDKTAKIKTTDGKITALNSIDGKLGESIFEFFSESKRFDFGNGYIFKGYSLKFEKGRWFFDYKGNAKLNSLNIINEGKTYIDFKGEINKEYKGAYISIDDKRGVFVTGSNINERGPRISFTKDNPYGLKISENDHFAVWSLGNPKGAYVRIMNRDKKGRVPLMDTLNQFAINFDEKSTHYSYSKEKLFFSPKVILTGFQTAKTTSAIEIHNFRRNFNNIQPISSSDGKPNIFGITPEAQWAYGINPEFIKTDVPYKGYSSLKTGFSNSWLYYNIGSVAELQRLTGVKISDNTGLLNNVGYRKMFVDVMLGLQSPVLKNLREMDSGITIKRHAWYAGLASNDFINIKSSSFNPETLRHEMSHVRHFALGNDFDSLWNSVRGRGGYVTDYARTNNYEDIAETASYVYQPSFWSGKLNGEYGPIFKGKLAVLAHPKYNVITKEEFEALGLDYSKINDYILEAQKFSGRR